MKVRLCSSTPPAVSILLEPLVGRRNCLCLTEKGQGLLTCLVNPHGDGWWGFWLISCGILKNEQMYHGEMHFTSWTLGESTGYVLWLCVLTYLDWTFNSMFCKVQVSWLCSNMDNYILLQLCLQSQAGTRLIIIATANKRLLCTSQHMGRFPCITSNPFHNPAE